MAWQFWRGRSGPKPLGTDLRNSLISVFDLKPEELNSLLVMRQGGKFAGRPVTRFRVYDPAQIINGSSGEVTRYRQLDAHPEAVCFQGHVERNGSISVNDRRNSAAVDTKA